MQIQSKDLDLTMLKINLLNKWLLLLLLSSLFISICLISCAKETIENKNEEAVVFTDALDREVSIKKSPERVAALIGSFADVWVSSGGTVCATAEDAWDDFGLMLDSAVNIGKTKEPSLELLLSSNPDFVLASASTTANVEMKDVLESAGITVAYFKVDNFEDYLYMLDVCTDITGRKDLYKKNGTDIKEQIDALKNSLQASDIPDGKKTVLFLRASSGYIRAKNSNGSILGEMLKDLGCINIADSDGSLLENLSIESIIKSDPYRIFIVEVGDNKQAARDNISKMMEENPVWYDLQAIKENRIYYMDNRLFNLKPNARWNEAYETLCKILTE